MQVVEFTVYGVALSKGNMKTNVVWKRDEVTGRKRPVPVTHHANPELPRWEQTIEEVIQREAKGHFFDGPVSVRLEFHMPRPKSAPKRVVLPCVAPDLDKLIRGALDACSGPLWLDDSQVVAVVAMKCYAVDRPKVVYRIAEVEGAAPLEDPHLTLPF